VFSGITADDIDTERASGRGVAALKTFLAFAAGPIDAPRAAGAIDAPRAAGATAPRGGNDATGGAIAQALSEAVREAGRDPVERVGLAGLFLDVAARGEQGYELGIEADAGDWAALRCARDRERGRQSALEMMGWKLARSWSLAWYARPDAEAARIAAALGAAPSVAAAAAAPAAPPPEPGLAEPYRESDATLPEGAAIATMAAADLAALIAAIVATEAPLPQDSLLERLRIVARREALSPAERNAVRAALTIARDRHGVTESAGVLARADTKAVPRDRRGAAAHLRRAAAVPPAEVAAAAEALLARRPGLTEAELAPAIHALLGLDPGAEVAIAARVAALVGAGTIRLG
jgi:hypothetical protein